MLANLIAQEAHHHAVEAAGSTGAAGLLMALVNTFLDMAPYLLLGFIFAGILSVLISPKMVERHLGGHGIWPVIKAALFGVPLPLCSCSVLPVTASLRRHGAGRGASTAFLISTPQTGVDSILATWSLLGPLFAIYKPIMAFISGIIGGAVVDVLEPHGNEDTEVVPKCEGACCAHLGENGESVGPRQSWFRRAIEHSFVELPRDLGKPLLIGLVAAGVITAAATFFQSKFSANETLFQALGLTGLAGILVAMAVGIPLYVCATASIPIAAAMIAAGASYGAAFAFLMTGPASNAASLAVIWKVLGKRTAIIYLVTIAATALGAGVLLDLMAVEFKLPTITGGEILPLWAKIASSIFFVAILLRAFWPSKGKKPCCEHHTDGEHPHDDKNPEHGHDHHHDENCHNDDCKDDHDHDGGHGDCCGHKH